MLTASVRLADGIVLSLAYLRRVLDELGRDHGRWWLEEPPVSRRTPTRRSAVQRVEVFHSSYGPDQVTDELSFLVPVVAFGNSSDEEHTLVWLHPELLEPRMEGLYLEDRLIKSDFITDWERFWIPLKHAASRFIAERAERSG